MKQRLQGIIIGIVITSLLTGGLVFAKQGAETIQAMYSDIKIYIDGVKADPQDATGAAVEPFIYNGTTYLPVRGVANALGKSVYWDGDTQSIYLGVNPKEKQYLLDVCPPYEAIGVRFYTTKDGTSVSMAGKKYTNGFVTEFTNTSLYNLDGKYTEMNFDYGHIDGAGMSQHNEKFQVFLDGNLVNEIELNPEMLVKNVTISLKHALQMKIKYQDGYDGRYALANITIK